MQHLSHSTYSIELPFIKSHYFSFTYEWKQLLLNKLPRTLVGHVIRCRNVPISYSFNSYSNPNLTHSRASVVSVIAYAWENFSLMVEQVQFCLISVQTDNTPHQSSQCAIIQKYIDVFSSLCLKYPFRIIFKYPSVFFLFFFLFVFVFFFFVCHLLAVAQFCMIILCFLNQISRLLCVPAIVFGFLQWTTWPSSEKENCLFEPCKASQSSSISPFK